MCTRACVQRVATTWRASRQCGPGWSGSPPCRGTCRRPVRSVRGLLPIDIRPLGVPHIGPALTRRGFLKVAGASLLGAWGLSSGCTPRPEREDAPNVVLVIVDSVRRDHVGVYGNGWIHTPNLDALAKESLRFSRAYPESIPTLCARRAIHTGTRTWPFRDWHPARDDDIRLWGWQPIPNYQTTLAEVLRSNGYGTYFVTDNLQQYKASMNFHRGFDAFHFIRGQTSDGYKPAYTSPPQKVERALTNGTGELEENLRQYFANVAGRQTEADWFSPIVYTRAAEYLELLSEGGPFFLTVDSYDPHEPWDPPEEYVEMYDDRPYHDKEPYWVLSGPNNYLD